jgi:hypothetical protein
LAVLLGALAVGRALAQQAPDPLLTPPPPMPKTDQPAEPPPWLPPSAAPPAPEGAPCPSRPGDGDDWKSRVPPIHRTPPPGVFLVPPTGPGYYTLRDQLEGDEREGPPKYPYPRFCLMTTSFFDVDWRYLDRPSNTEHDFFDFLKRVPLGDDFLFTTGGELRVRSIEEFDSRLTGVTNEYTLFRARVYGDLWYRDLFRVYVEGYYADSSPQTLAPLVIDRDRGDLLNAFVDVKAWELDRNNIYFRAGRQELLYGSQRLISPLDWANTRRTFQGAKLFYASEDLDVDLFSVQPVIPNRNHGDSVDWHQLFSGAWTTYRPCKGQSLDAYVLNLEQGRKVAAGEGGHLGGFNITTVGSRYAGNLSNWLIDVEGMLQFGDFSNQTDLANAYTTAAGYDFKDAPWDPQFWVSFDHASGDPHPGVGGIHRTFNQLFPFGHYCFGFIDLVGRQNIDDLNFQFACYPEPWITALVQYHMFRLDHGRDALYSSAGTVERIDPTGRAGRNVGDEIAWLVNFHLTSHQDVLVGYEHLWAGPFLQQTGPGTSPDYLYLQYMYRW